MHGSVVGGNGLEGNQTSNNHSLFRSSLNDPNKKIETFLLAALTLNLSCEKGNALHNVLEPVFQGVPIAAPYLDYSK